MAVIVVLQSLNKAYLRSLLMFDFQDVKSMMESAISMAGSPSLFSLIFLINLVSFKISFDLLTGEKVGFSTLALR